MKEQIVKQFIEVTGFTPLEILLMGTVAGLFALLFKVMSKNNRQVITAIHDSSKAVENNSKAVENNSVAIKELRQELVNNRQRR